MKILIPLMLSLFITSQIHAEMISEPLSLDSCRALALKNNKELRAADNHQKAAGYERKAAFTKFLPHISASGTYLYTSKEISLLSDEQKGALNSLGTTVGTLVPSLKGMEGALNGVGGTLVEGLHTDTRQMGAVGVMLTQPVYMGGKIVAYNRITHYAEQIARLQHDLALEDVVVAVDEAYWRIVSLKSRKRLAQSYYDLVCRLDSDVQRMIAEGVATKADGLSVRVKVNEAKVALIQVDNGLSLSRMALCQLCGLEMTSPITVTDEADDTQVADPVPATAEVETALNRRHELNMLSLSSDIYRQKIRLARAEFLPSVALTGGYMASNPSVFNSFERQMKGMWNVGVMVNVPLVTFGERIYKVKAAREEAKAAYTRLEETREKVILQVNQNKQKVQEAFERLNTSRQSTEEADENLRYAILGLKEGVIPVSHVLEAQTAWMKAHAEMVSARIDLTLANTYLLKSAGSLPVKGY